MKTLKYYLKTKTFRKNSIVTAFNYLRHPRTHIELNFNFYRNHMEGVKQGRECEGVRRGGTGFAQTIYIWSKFLNLKRVAGYSKLFISFKCISTANPRESEIIIHIYRILFLERIPLILVVHYTIRYLSSWTQNILS